MRIVDDHVIHTTQIKLDRQKSVFQAEFLVIVYAIRWANNSTFKSYTLYLGGFSSLQSLRIIHNIFINKNFVPETLLENFSPSMGAWHHTGVFGNEINDHLANEATE